jgi:hypothetical protein
MDPELKSACLAVGNLAGEHERLRKHAKRMEVALQVIMDVAQKWFEYNPVSNTALLPIGYRKILNTAHHALTSD